MRRRLGHELGPLKPHPSPLPTKLLLTIAAYVAALVVVAALTFFVVIFLAGPHAGLLPHALEVVVFVLGWLFVLVLPVLAARTV